MQGWISTRRWRDLAATAMVALLAACGGGGSGNAKLNTVETASGPVAAIVQNGMLAYRRIQAMAQVRPIRLARLATGLAGCCLGLAAGGVMLILA